MSSAAEAELGALYITAKEIVSIRQTLIEIGWKQPPFAIQTNNLTADGFVNKIIIQCKSNYMDLRFHCLIFRKSQGKFRFYWAPGHLNWGDYSTQHHPPIYHTNNRPQFAGYVNISKKE